MSFPIPRARPARTTRAIAIALGVAACQSPPPAPVIGPLLPRDHRVERRNWIGSVVGERAGDAVPDAAPRHTATVALRLFALASWPATEGFGTLAEHVRLVLDLEDEEPVLPATALAPEARIGLGEAARQFLERLEAGELGRYEELDGSRHPLPLGTSRSLGIEAVEVVVDPNNFLREHPPIGPMEKRVVLHVSHAADDEPYGVALFLEDAGRPLPDPRAGERLTGEPPADALQPLQELVVLDTGPRPNEPLAIVLPSPFENASAEAWLAWVEVLPPPPEDAAAAASHDDAFEAALTALEAELDRRTLLGTVDAERLVLERALASLASTGNDRSTLVYLAEATEAPMTRELALFATPELLAQLIEPIERSASELAEEGVSIGWLIERATYRELARRATEGSLSPELEAVLLRHTGEAGRYPSAIEQAAAASADLAAFERTLEQENRISLEDSNPSARVRAFDWLELRGRAPQGYDPLASRNERRAALAAAGEADER